MSYTKIDKKRIQNAVKRANVEEILQTLDVRYKKHRNDDLWFKCVMRNHRNDKTASAHINCDPLNPYHGVWSCFGCNSAGTIIALIQHVRDTTFREALAITERIQHTDLPVLDDIEVEQVEVVKPFYNHRLIDLPKLAQFPTTEQEWDHEYLSYLYKRDIEWSQIQEHHIGYVDGGKYDGRIICPVLLFDELRTFVARSIVPKSDLPVLTPFEGMPGLFGSELSDVRKGPAIISEGWADALAIERVGYPNSMSCQTDRLHPDQIKFLKDFRYTIIIPDNDNGGRIFIDSLAEYIYDMQIYIARLTESKDPAESWLRNGMLEIEHAIQEAEPWKPAEEIFEIELSY